MGDKGEKYLFLFCFLKKKKQRKKTTESFPLERKKSI